MLQHSDSLLPSRSAHLLTGQLLALLNKHFCRSFWQSVVVKPQYIEPCWIMCSIEMFAAKMLLAGICGSASVTGSTPQRPIV